MNQIKDDDLRRLVGVLCSSRQIQRAILKAEIEALVLYAQDPTAFARVLPNLIAGTVRLKQTLRQTRGPQGMMVMDPGECGDGLCPTPDGLCEPC